MTIGNEYAESVKDDGVTVCDSGAGFSAFKDISLFPQGVWKAENYTLISGVQKGGDPIKVTLEGMTKFGFVGYSTEADMNILSLADVDEKCAEWFSTGDIIQIRQRDEIFMFKKRDDRIHIWRPENGITHEDTHKSRNKDNSVPKIFSLITVDGQKKLYTNQQINDADKAKIFQANMGYIHENRLIKMIRLSKIINCEVTEDDVKRSAIIYGKSIDYIKGNSNAKQGEPIKFEG